MGRAVYCAIQNRQDQAIRIRSLLPASWGGSRSWEGATSTLYTRKGPPRSLQVLKQTFAEEEDAWMLRVVAAMIGLRRTRQLNTPKHGCDLVIWSRLPEGEGYGDKAAFGTAVALALKAATGLAKKRVDGIMVARAVVQGAREVLGERISMTSALTSGLGRRGCALLIEHGMDPTMQWVPMPRQCVVAAFDTGEEEPVPAEDRQAVEVGTAMALEHLNQAQQKARQPSYGGWGQITPGEFEGGVRSQVPTKETGQEWLKAFRRKVDWASRVDPERAYRERALAEHHVRETSRVRRMVSNLTEYGRTMREGFMVEAGRCLFSSQRSLREKCGVSYGAAEEFVDTVRESGRADALFGARMTEAGGSGVLVVLAQQSGLQALRDMGEAWARKRKQGGSVLADTSDGGVLNGWWEGVLETPQADLASVAVPGPVDEDADGPGSGT